MTELQVAWRPAEPEATCDVIVGSRFPETLQQPLTDAVNAFAAAADYGMFAGSGHDPTASSFAPIQPPPTGLGERRRWRYHVRSVDVGAFRVLFNVLEHECPGSGSDLVVEVKGGPGSDSRIIDTASVQAVAYPAANVETVFPVVDELKEPTSREVIVRVDFRGELLDAQAEAVFQALDAWVDVVKRGGFPGPHGADVVGSLTASDRYLVSPSLVELAVYGYIGPVETFSGLLNILHRVHRGISPIAGVELE